jgi:hypothetical protein
MIWRTEMQARVQGRVELKDSICFKWVQIGFYKCGPWTHVKQAEKSKASTMAVMATGIASYLLLRLFDFNSSNCYILWSIVKTVFFSQNWNWNR